MKWGVCAAGTLRQSAIILLITSVWHPALGDGGPDVANVPALVGRGVKEADAALKQQGLNAKYVLGDAAPTDEKAMTVYGQSPEAGTSVAAGSQVTLTLYDAPRESQSETGRTDATGSSARQGLIVGPERAAIADHGMASPVVRVPCVVGQTDQDASARLRTAGLRPKIAFGKFAPSREKEFTVYSQDPKEDEQVVTGSVVTLIVHGGFAANDSDSGSSAVSGGQFRNRLHWLARHEIHRSEPPLATDLAHGYGDRRVVVQRAWVGLAADAGHFGPGWADTNVISLSQSGADLLIAWRGGRPWFFAERQGDDYVIPNAGKIVATDRGWEWSAPSGARLDFDKTGRLVLWKTAFNTDISYSYSPQAGLTKIRLGETTLLTYSYEADGKRVASVAGPEGLTASYRYDEQGRLREVTNSRQVTVKYEYTEDGQLAAASDSFGNRMTFPPPSDEDAAEEIDEKAGQDNLKKLKDLAEYVAPQPPPPVKSYDEQGRLVEVRQRGRATSYKYDEQGRVQSRTTELGTDQFKYDAFGRIVTARLWNGREISAEYSPLDQLARVGASDGSWRKVEYDQHGLPTRYEWSSGTSREIQYNDLGLVSSVKTAPGREATIQYNARRQRERIRFSNGPEVQFGYDDHGNIANAAWSTGETLRRRFDDQNHLIEQTAGDLTRRYGYNEHGFLAWVEDPVYGRREFDYGKLSESELGVNWKDLGTWRFRFNAWKQPLAITDAAGQATRFEYDRRGAPVSARTATSRFWRYAHDDAGRLVGVTSPNGTQVVSLTRDALGRIRAVQRTTTRHRDYVYDNDGRLVLEQSAGGIAGAYSYDATGRINEAVLPDSTWTFRHNELDQIVVAESDDHRLQQEFHPDGRLARRFYESAGLDLQLPIDEFGRAAGVTLNDVAVNYEYDARGRLSRIQLPNEIAISISRDKASRPTAFRFGEAVRIDVEYDPLNRLTFLGAKNAAAVDLFAEHYRYDAAGNLDSIENVAGPPLSFTYDADNRLVSGKVANDTVEFEYDLDDNLRAVKTNGQESRWQLDSSGRPVVRDVIAFNEWDEAGNLVNVQGVDTDVAHQFDAAGRLTQRRIGPYEWHFGYLPNGDRLWQEGPSGRLWYAYLGTGLVGLKDESGTTWLLVNLPGTDWPLALCGSNGTTYILVADRLRSIRRVVDAQGEVVSSSDYGPYGQLVAGDGFAPLQMYAGMICDEHGLHYARRRYYDPMLCRFISIDPRIGTYRSPATHNAYAYAANNPLRYRDPLGTQVKKGGDPSITADSLLNDALRDYGGHVARSVAREMRPVDWMNLARDQTRAMVRDTMDEIGHRLQAIDRRLDEVARQVLRYLPADPSGADLRPAGVSDRSAVDREATTSSAPRSRTDDSGFGSLNPYWPYDENESAAANTPDRIDGSPDIPDAREPATDAVPSSRPPDQVVPLLPQVQGSDTVVQSPQDPATPGAVSNDSSALGPLSPNEVMTDIATRGVDVRPVSADEVLTAIIRAALPRIQAQQAAGGPPLDVGTLINGILANLAGESDNPDAQAVNRVLPPPTANQDRKIQAAIREATRLAKQNQAIEANSVRQREEFGPAVEELGDRVREFIRRTHELEDKSQHFVELVEATETLAKSVDKAKHPDDDTMRLLETLVDSALSRAEDQEQRVCQVLLKTYVTNPDAYTNDALSKIRLGLRDEIVGVGKAIMLAKNDLDDATSIPRDQVDRLRNLLNELGDMVQVQQELQKERDEIRASLEELLTEAAASYRRMTGNTEDTVSASLVSIDQILIPERAKQIKRILTNAGAWRTLEGARLLAQAERWESFTPVLYLGLKREESETYQRLIVPRTFTLSLIPETAEEDIEKARTVLAEAESLLEPNADVPQPAKETNADSKQLATDKDAQDVTLASLYQKIEEAKTQYRAARNCYYRLGEQVRTTSPIGADLYQTIDPQVALVRPRKKSVGKLPAVAFSPHPLSAVVPPQLAPSGVNQALPDPTHAPPLTPPAGNRATVPSLRGFTAQEAKKRVDQAGLTPVFVLGKDAPDKESEHRVYSQQPAAGTKVALNDNVRITFHNKARTLTGATTVPAVTNLPAAEASQKLKEVGLTPKFQLGKPAGAGNKVYQVYEQSPAAGSKVAEGADVRVIFYGDSKPPAVASRTPSLGETRSSPSSRPSNPLPSHPTPSLPARPQRMSSTPPLPARPMPSQPAPKSLTGRWRCSCGEVWTLSQNGTSVTGTESGGRTVSGTFDGSHFRFRFTDSSRGISGTGVMTANSSLTKMNWRMTRSDTHQSWDGSVTRATPSPAPTRSAPTPQSSSAQPARMFRIIAQGKPLSLYDRFRWQVAGDGKASVIMYPSAQGQRLGFRSISATAVLDRGSTYALSIGPQVASQMTARFSREVPGLKVSATYDLKITPSGRDMDMILIQRFQTNMDNDPNAAIFGFSGEQRTFRGVGKQE